MHQQVRTNLDFALAKTSSKLAYRVRGNRNLCPLAYEPKFTMMYLIRFDKKRHESA